MCISLFSIIACSPTTPTDTEPVTDTATPIPERISITPTPTVDPMVFIRDATVFEASFEKGIHPEIFDREANWETQQDDGNTIYCNIVAKEWTNFNFGSPLLENYAFEANIQFVGGGTNASVVMNFRVNNFSGYGININKNYSNFSIMNPWSNLGGANLNLKNGEWYTFRVEAMGQTFSFYIDDELVTTAMDSEIVTGHAGIAASGNAKICVDDLKLWTIDENGPIVLEDMPGLIYIDSIPTSEYFGKVELLESTTISLVPIGQEIHTIRTAELHDMDGDGVDDVILQMATYNEMEYHPLVILSGDGPVENIAGQVFPLGVVEIAHANQMTFADFNNDGLEDLLTSEAGLDKEPWYREDATPGIGLNNGDGTWVDVSDTIPQETIGLRNYSFAVGDIYTDGIIRMLLPGGRGLLFWDVTGFEFDQDWISQDLWVNNMFGFTSFMAVKDIDDDGWQDIYTAGNQTTPNHRIIYGGEDSPSANYIYELPETPYGHEPWGNLNGPGQQSILGADVGRTVIEDFDGDGDLDIVSVAEETTTHKKQNGEIVTVYGNMWFQVLRNDGARQFTDIIMQGREVGYNYYISLLPLDLDLDGDLDLIGHYWSKEIRREHEKCVPMWGTTFFINDGGSAFTIIDAEDIFPELTLEAQFPSNAVNSDSSLAECSVMGWGAFFPTQITASGMKGLFVAPIEFDVDNPRLRVLRVSAEGSDGLLAIP